MFIACWIIVHNLRNLFLFCKTCFDKNAFLLFSEENVVYFYTVYTLICNTRLDASVIKIEFVIGFNWSHQITMVIDFCIEFLLLSREWFLAYFLKHFYETVKIRLTVTKWVQKGPICWIVRHILCCLDFIHYTDEFTIIITRAWWFAVVDIE